MRTRIPAHIVGVLEAGLARIQSWIGVGKTQITCAVDCQAGQTEAWIKEVRACGAFNRSFDHPKPASLTARGIKVVVYFGAPYAFRNGEAGLLLYAFSLE